MKQPSRYVSQNLIDGESIIYSAEVHWWVFITPTSIILFSILLFSMDYRAFSFMALMVFLFGLSALIGAYIQRITTELVVTNKRIIAKFGFIRRHTLEINHSKLEGMIVDQSILGRIMDFGTLVMTGTGGGRTPIPNIDHPFEFRKAALEASEASMKGAL